MKDKTIINNIKLLDGAMGSEFIKRGINLPNHIWSAHLNLEASEVIYKIHKEYINAGADYITTNTFRTTPRAYSKIGLPLKEAKKSAELSLKSAIRIAKNRAKTAAEFKMAETAKNISTNGEGTGEENQ